MDVGAAITKDIITKAVIVIVIIVLGYLLVVRPVLKKFGVIKTAEDRAQEKQEATLSTSLNSPFSPRYYQGKSNVMLTTRTAAEQIAKTIYKAMGFFNDNEEAVFGALRQLQYKTQLSWVADVFFQLYKEDMYQYIRNSLSDDEMKIVNQIAANLK